MKVKYIANYNGRSEMGVSKKLLFQINSLNKIEGVDAELILLSNKTDPRMLELGNVSFYHFPSPPYKGIYNKIKAFLAIESEYEKLLKSFGKDDVLYLRNFFPTKGFAKVISRIENPIYLDVVSHNIEEARIRKSNFLYQFNLQRYSSSVANQFSGITGVTEEIIKLNFPRLRSGMPILEIGNGFDPLSVPVNPPKKLAEDEHINFICVAHISPWHGLDRFIRGMSQYTGNKSIHFHVVGDGPDREMLVDLMTELNLENHITFHGFKSGKELDELYKISHLGVGNLGTFKKGIKYTSPLKSKEYCSRGLPFFFTCIDKDFIDFPYAVNVPSDNSPIQIKELIDHFGEVTKKLDYHLEMKNYAVEKLSWDSKMKEVYHFMVDNYPND